MGSEILSDFEKYKTQVEKCIGEFVGLLGGDYDRLKNTDTFNGLITYIGNHVFKSPSSPVNSIINTDDIPLLTNLFDYYCTICSVYGNKPYIIQYCLFIYIDSDTFFKWSTGMVKPNSDRIRFCQMVHRATEQAQVSADTVKSIFLLKAKYGYVETPQQIALTTEIKQPTADLIGKYKDYPKLK